VVGGGTGVVVVVNKTSVGHCRCTVWVDGWSSHLAGVGRTI